MHRMQVCCASKNQIRCGLHRTINYHQYDFTENKNVFANTNLSNYYYFFSCYQCLGSIVTQALKVLVNAHPDWNNNNNNSATVNSFAVVIKHLNFQQVCCVYVCVQSSGRGPYACGSIYDICHAFMSATAYPPTSILIIFLVKSDEGFHNNIRKTSFS